MLNVLALIQIYYSFIGKSDSSLIVGAISIIIINSLLIFLCYLMFRSGYKLKS